MTYGLIMWKGPFRISNLYKRTTARMLKSVFGATFWLELSPFACIKSYSPPCRLSTLIILDTYVLDLPIIYFIETCMFLDVVIIYLILTHLRSFWYISGVISIVAWSGDISVFSNFSILFLPTYCTGNSLRSLQCTGCPFHTFMA